MRGLTRFIQYTALGLLFCGQVQSQTDSAIFSNPELNRDYGFNYQELNNIDPSVETLTTDLFGDTIDPGSGSLRFSQTDVSLPGNFALPVAITRTLGDPSSWHRENLLFGSWSLDIPHVRSNFVARGGMHGNAYWAVQEACSRSLNSNPSFGSRGHYIHEGDYWNGDTAYIPGQGSATFLDTDPGDVNHDPSEPTKRFNNQNWEVSCYDDENRSNEGFEITTGDGTTYFFSQQLIRKEILPRNMVPAQQSANCGGNDCTMTFPGPSDGSDENTVDAYQIFMLVTKVVDRFGNKVEYNYTQGTGTILAEELADDDPRLDVKLDSIIASDGRSITLEYNTDGYIDKVITGNQVPEKKRTWDYRYDGFALVGVDLPNGQSWEFDNGSTPTSANFWFERFPPTLFFGDTCLNGTSVPDNRFITITHPYGMKGEFHIGGQCFGQVDVPQLVQLVPTSNEPSHWIKRENRNIVIKRKTLTFTDGTLPYTWTYDYSFNKGLFLDEDSTACTAPAGPLDICHTVDFDGSDRPDLKTTTITQPNGDYSIHYFDRTYGVNRDNLVAMETYEFNGTSNGTLLSRSRYEYDPTDPYGDNQSRVKGFVIADSPARPDGLKNSYRDQVLVRTKKRTTELFNGASSLGSYTQEILDFDTYNQPIKVKGSSEQGTRYIRYDYLPKTTKGVFNLPTRTRISTADNNYTEVSRTTYKSLSGVQVPDKTYGYGQLKQTNMSYHTTTGEIGQPKRVEYNAALKEGTGNRYLEYLDYHRGIPREVKMPQRLSASTQSARRTVDDNGWVTSFTDLNGNTTRYGYDKMGRFTYIDQPNDANNWLDTTFTWTAQTSNTGPKRTQRRCILNGTGCSGAAAYTEELSFDNLLRPTLTKRTASGQNRYQAKTFDSYNQETFTSFWEDTASSAINGGGTTNTFDALQRLRRQSTTGLGEVITNYLSNNRMQTIDAEGNHTTTTYLAYGQPSYEQATTIASPESVTTTLSVDVFGLVNRIKQGTQTEYRAYNSFKQLCQVKRSDVGTTAYTLNALGQPTAMASGVTNNSNTACLSTLPANLHVTTTYDNLGDVRTMNYPDTSPDLTYTYDRQGNLTRLQAGSTSHTYTYNSLHLLESEALTVSGRSGALNLDYGYNNLGHVASLTYPNNDLITFAPNGFGEPTKASSTRGNLADMDYVSNATYYPTGSINTFTYGNGLSHKTTLNAAKLPSRIKDLRTGVTALDYSYTYDNNQNVKSLTDNQNPAFNLNSLTYDGLDRLKTVSAGSGIGNSSMTYDALGNIKTYNNAQQHLTYLYNTANQLTSVNKTDSPTVNAYRAFTYDDRGNVTSNGMRGFTFNLANQLESSGTNTYTYDGHNRRVKQTDSKGTSYSMYSQDGTLLYRETQDGGINYIYLGKRLVAKDGFIPENAGDQHFYPYGSSVEGEIDDAGYTGHKFDTDLGLSYMQARYYDPMIGRFYSNDPVDTLGHFSRGNGANGFNRYAYANNNPYKYTDPDGEFVNFAIKFVADVALGAALNFAETGELNLGGAVTDAAVGVLNPAKTLQKAKRLSKVISGGCSFTPETMILTKDGYKTIVEVNIGDIVLSKNDETGELAWREVTDTFKDWHQTTLTFKAVDENGVEELITTTAEHPFYIEDYGWTPAGDIAEGSLISGPKSDNQISIISIEVNNEAQYAYNFTVDTDHTYFVGKTNMWVHNMCKKSLKSTTQVGDNVKTPDNSPEGFTKLKGGQGFKENKTGTIMQKSNTNHSNSPGGEFKAGTKPGETPTPSKKVTISGGAEGGCVLKKDGC